MRTVTIHVNEDPSALSPGADYVDVERYGSNLCWKLDEEFPGLWVEYELASGPSGCAEHAGIHARIRELEDSNAWVCIAWGSK